MSGRRLYQDVTEAELARERRYEKRRERASKVARARRLADLREAEEMSDGVYYFSPHGENMFAAWAGDKPDV